MNIQPSTKLLLPILCFIFMLLPSLVVAQSLNKLPEVIPPSPTVSNLMHFEEVPIDNYSGQPNIEIPIYTKKIGSSFSLPLSIRYSTMGIRVDERSGWLGNGWSLSGEGVISRTVMHILDEVNDITPNPNGRYEIGILHNGFFSHDFTTPGQHQSASNEPLQNFLWNAAGAGSGQYNSVTEENGAYDKEFDLYQLNLFGMSARFIVVNNNNNLEAKMLNNDFNLKIIINHNASTFEINHFTVIDTHGMKYQMSVKESQTVNTGSASIGQNGEQSSFSANTFQYTSAWKISSVKNSNNQSLATFEYQTVTEEFNAPKSYTEAQIRGNSIGGIPPNELFGYQGDTNHDVLGQKAYNNSVVIPKRTVTHTSIVVNSQKLFKVLFNDQTEIKISLENYQHPEYNSSGGVLKKIEVKDANGNVSKNIDFVYTTTPNDRLFLTSLEETMGSITQSYALNYDDMTDLPNVKNFDANFSIKDMWGYYRGPESYGVLDIYKYGQLTNKNFVTTGVLTSITYPTGGIKEFNFEPNTFDHRGSLPFTNTDFKLLNKDNWIENNVSIKHNNANPNNDINPSPIFHVSEGQKAQLTLTFTINENTNDTNDYLSNTPIRLEKVDVNGNVIEILGNFDFKNNAITTITESGFYRLTYVDLNDYHPNDSVLEVIGTLHYKDFKNPLNNYIYGGGLRIQSVVFKDNDLSIEKEIQYHYGDSGGQQPNDTSTTGVIDGFLTNRKEYSRVESYILTYGTSGGNGITPEPFPVGITFDMVEHMNNVYVSMNKSSYVGYEKVAVLETGNGRSVFSYTSPAINNYNTYSSSFGYPFTPEKDKSHLHGALLNAKIYDNSNRIIKETSNDYYPPIEISQGTYPHIYDFPLCPEGRFYAKYSSYLNETPDPGREHPSYGQNSSNYGNCNNPDTLYPLAAPLFYEDIDLYFTKFLLKESISKDYFYSGSTAKIVETTKEFIYNDDNYQIAEEKTSLNGTSDYYQTKYYYPVNTNIPSNYQGSTSSITKLNTLNKVNEVLVSEQYKNGAKLSETHTTYFEPSTNLVMPNRIKTAKNGNTLEDRIVYHRYDVYGNPQEVSQKDGMHITYVWGYNGQYPVAKLENCSYSAIPINLRNSIENATPSGMANALQLLRNSSDVDVKKAMITTITYNPLFGVTTVTDPKGDTQTYFYDDFSRLEMVKDKQGKILQEYEYHYKN